MTLGERFAAAPGKRMLRTAMRGGRLGLMCTAATALFACSASANNASDVNVYVGYADNGSANVHQLPSAYPSPWQGSPRVNFVGQGADGNKYDSGAIRVDNTTNSDITAQSVSLDIGAKHYELWGSNLRIPAHGSLILAQTQIVTPTPLLSNFDTSEVAGETCNPSQPGGAGVVHVTINGHRNDITDNDKILDTGGKDIGVCAGKPNESHRWDFLGGFTAQGNAPAATGLGDAGLVGITAGLISLLSFIPALIGGLLLLLVGWLLARFLGGLLAGILDRIGLGPAIERTGLLGFLAARRRNQRHTTASWVLGALFGWFIFLFFLIAAAQAFHVEAITNLLTQVALWLPKLITALVILFVGALLARFLARIVHGAAAASGFGAAGLLANITRVAVIGFALLIALDQVSIAQPFVDALFGALVLALALAVGLAFGLGGRDTAARMLQSWYGNTRPDPPDRRRQ